jgi:hypothetical protein
VEETVEVTVQSAGGGAILENIHHDDGVENSGGANEAGEADGSVDATGEVVELVQQGTETQTSTVGGQTTDAKSAPFLNEDMNHGDVDMVDSSDYDETPLKFRSLNEVYQDSVEVELTSDDEVQALLSVMEEPNSYQDAASDLDWEKAMESEIQSINKNKTWELLKLPAGHKPIGLKWVFKLKKNAEGEIVKHKARLVAKDYVQK